MAPLRAALAEHASSAKTPQCNKLNATSASGPNERSLSVDRRLWKRISAHRTTPELSSCPEDLGDSCRGLGLDAWAMVRTSRTHGYLLASHQLQRDGVTVLNMHPDNLYYLLFTHSQFIEIAFKVRLGIHKKHSRNFLKWTTSKHAFAPFSFL